MTEHMITALIRIDGETPARMGNLEVVQESVGVTSLTASKPNLAWTFRDAAGHFHAFAKDGSLPTLATSSIHDPGCIGNCEDLDYEFQCGVRHPYVCRVCGEEIKPERTPDPGPHYMPGRKSWSVLVYGVDLEFGQEVSITAEDSATGRVWAFGVAKVGPRNVRSNGATLQTETLLYGQGELGNR